MWFIWFSNMSKLVQNQYDMILKHVYTCSESIWYELIQFINMSRLEMKTWRNTLKLSKWHEKVFFWHWKVIPWIASSKSSDQKHVPTALVSLVVSVCSSTKLCNPLIRVSKKVRAAHYAFKRNEDTCDFEAQSMDYTVC